MLPVSAWPPGPPGASLSPFGTPRQINVGCHVHGYVIPKGAWIVRTGSNRVVMFTPTYDPWLNIPRTPGTGYLPGQTPPQPPSCGCPPKPPRSFPKFNTVVEAYRAAGKIGPPPGRRPPNWFGWRHDPCAPGATLVQSNSAGLVLADGQNVVIGGSGFAQITQA
jgi:hypothetical protein